MNFKHLRIDFREKITPLYNAEEIDAIFFIGLEALFGIKKIDFVLQPNDMLSTENLVVWEKFTAALATGKPIQYIIGKTEFYGMPFIVDENVLIPRPETEQLLEWILVDFKNNSAISLLDIGSGSGCIPIVLNSKMPQSKITSWDVSEKALEISKQNNELNKTNVNFELQDVLKVNKISFPIDVIVSNPPYVQISEQVSMKTNVLHFEPHLALFVPENDPLLFYKKIGKLAWHHLKTGGCLYFEINQYLGKETLELLQNIGFQNLELRKDFRNNDRMVKAVK